MPSANSPPWPRYANIVLRAKVGVGVGQRSSVLPCQSTSTGCVFSVVRCSTAGQQEWWDQRVPTSLTELCVTAIIHVCVTKTTTNRQKKKTKAKNELAWIKLHQSVLSGKLDRCFNVVSVSDFLSLEWSRCCNAAEPVEVHSSTRVRANQLHCRGRSEKGWTHIWRNLGVQATWLSKQRFFRC